MRTARIITVTAAVVVLGTGAAGCVTTVSGSGQADPAATSQPAATGSATPAPPDGSPSAAPTGSPAPSSLPSVDAATNRRITCALIVPMVSDAVQKWNDYVNKKTSDRSAVAVTFNFDAATIDSLAGSLPAADPVRVNATALTTEMKAMATALQAGKNPTTSRFNTLTKQFQSSCPA